MNIINNLFLSFKKFQEIREKSKEQKVFFETKRYESMIAEEIKIFNKTTDEAMVERMIQGERIDTFKITETDYKKILEAIDAIKFKINFLLGYKKRKIEKIKNEIEFLNNKYKEILSIDFSITNSIEQMVENIPCKKILDYDVANKNNCSIDGNLIKFENFNVYDSSFNKSIDLTNHNITLEKSISNENILYVSLTNTKTSNDFIINIKQNGKNINIYNGKLKHNAIINIATKDVESINIYSEADISYALDTIKIKSFNGVCDFKKGYYAITTKNTAEINELYMQSKFDYDLYLFDISGEPNYNMEYESMKMFCERNLTKLTQNELIQKSINKDFTIIALFNTKNYCSTLIDIFYN